MYYPTQTVIDEAQTIHTDIMVAFFKDNELKDRMKEIFKKSVGYFTNEDYLYIRDRMESYLTKPLDNWNKLFRLMWDQAFYCKKNKYLSHTLADFEMTTTEILSQNGYCYVNGCIFGYGKIFEADLCKFGLTVAKDNYIKNITGLQSVEFETQEEADVVASTIGIGLSSITLFEDSGTYTTEITSGLVTHDLYAGYQGAFDTAGGVIGAVAGHVGAPLAVSVGGALLSGFYSIGDSIGKWLFSRKKK